jgi:hypothetical protein
MRPHSLLLRQAFPRRFARLFSRLSVSAEASAWTWDSLRGTRWDRIRAVASASSTTTNANPTAVSMAGSDLTPKPWSGTADSSFEVCPSGSLPIVSTVSRDTRSSVQRSRIA